LRLRAFASQTLFLLTACAAAPAEDAPPARGDAAPLDVPTLVRARSARLVLSSHWREKAALEAIHVDKGDGSSWRAAGGVKLALRGLRLELADELTLTFLDDHEHYVLYATGVELVETKATYLHRHTDLDAITIADGKLSLFSR